MGPPKGSNTADVALRPSGAPPASPLASPALEDRGRAPVPESEWSFDEVEDLLEAVEEHEGVQGSEKWSKVSRMLAEAGHGPTPPRTPDECRLQYLAVLIAWGSEQAQDT